MIMGFLRQKVDVFLIKPTKIDHSKVYNLEDSVNRCRVFKPDRIMERQYYYPVEVSWLWKAK
jgi:hypothetical protein